MNPVGTILKSRRNVPWKRILLASNSIILIIFLFNTIDLASLLDAFRSVSAAWLLLLFISAGLGMAGVAWRLHRMLSHFSAPQALSTSLRATISGLASSLVMISLIGSVLGRQLVLRRHGVSPSLLTILAGYERVVQILVGASIGVFGSLYLFGRDHLSEILPNLPIFQIGIAITLSVTLALAWAGPGREQRLLQRILRWRELIRFVEILAITLGVQIVTASTYVLAFLALGTDAAPLQLLAGAAVVSFAASLPISVNGWGVRELAAIAVFGQLGASPHEAVAGSVLVGLCSTIAILVATPYALVDSFRGTKAAASAEATMPSGQGKAVSPPLPGPADREMNQILAILCGLGAAVLLFFQIRLEISGNAVTVNLADPIALSALAALAAYFLFQHKLPIALPRPVWLWLGGITLVLMVGFLNGALQFGVTPWALSNRLFGWFVILGYVACGALVASQFGAHGRRVLLQTVLTTAVAVIIVRLGAFTFHYSGLVQFDNMSNFEGYSANRNTFAIMLLMTGAGLISLLPIFRIDSRYRLPLLAGGVLFLGLWQTGSKLGLVCVAMLVVSMIAFRPALWRDVLLTAVLAVGFYLLLSFLPHVLAYLGSTVQASQEGFGITAGLARSLEAFTPGTIDERTVSIRAGIALWLEHPLIGSGLGSAIRLNLGENGLPLVIHSTPIWILAEFGLVGLAVVLSLPCYLLWQTRAKLWRAIRRHRLSPYHMGLLGICLVFGLFGLGHEIAYQRLFWLLIGAFAAQAITSGPANDRQTPPPA